MMGTATTTTSAASEAGYSEAKEKAQSAFTDDDVQRAVDIAVTAGLAVQPNGPAKVTTYSYMKHTAIFAHAASEDGIEGGVKAVGRSYLTTEAGGMASEQVVDGSQRAVQQAAESEIVRKGVESANKNLDMPSERASKDTIGAMMSNGADALIDDVQDDE
jgi:hypothetical protein